MRASGNDKPAVAALMTVNAPDTIAPCHQWLGCAISTASPPSSTPAAAPHIANRDGDNSSYRR